MPFQELLLNCTVEWDTKLSVSTTKNHLNLELKTNYLVFLKMKISFIEVHKIIS